MEQDERSRLRRSAKRKSRETGSQRKSVVSPANFQLQTELLAEKRKQQREEKEVAQLRHAQQKIMGKKTVEDFAQLKLIRRQSAAERSQSLHCNGKTLNVVLRGKECDHRETKDRSTVSMQSRPLMSARQSKPDLASDTLPRRPQSAKPVLQTHHQHESISNIKEADQSASTQSKIHSKKKKRKKISERKSARLSPSKSAPVLPDRPIPKKINIIVNMRNLQLFEKPELSSSASSPVISREAWG